MTDSEVLELLKDALVYADPGKQDAARRMTLDSTLSDLGIESVAALEMAGYIEEKCGLQFPDDELASIADVRGFANLMRRPAA